MELDDAQFAAVHADDGQGSAARSEPETEAVPRAGGSPGRGAELVADLLEVTDLVPAERLAAVRERLGSETLPQALVNEGLALPAGIARARAARYGLPFVDLGAEGIDGRAVEAIPVRVLERVGALPYRISGDVLRVAVSDPGDIHAIDELRLATRYTVELAVAPRDDIDLELRRVARETEVWERTSLVEDELEVADEDGDDLDVDDGVSDAPLVRLVNSIVVQAAEDGASDIHFDPQDDALVVRFRIDGVLHEMQRVPKRLAPAVTTRVKVLAKLDIAERRKPQDGRITLNTKGAGRLLDIRVAVLPSVEGEVVVMRLLDKSKRIPTLSDLGFSEATRVRLESIVSRPTGALLATGPTGSGKTTSLYAMLAQVSRPEVNVITVEDPVEYRLRGLNQIQVNPKAGLTFSNALRSILRADPDIVMVGEIRDAETAKIAIEAALTGHFVLSTLHTNDAPSAVTRLNEMGVEPFLTGSAVSAVLAQRLARRLCTYCCEMYVPTEEELLSARFSRDRAESADEISLYRKRGCPRCNQTGYKGRVGIYQLMVMSETLEHLAAQRASREQLERAAMEEGMTTLWHDGLAKVTSGLTSLEEVARVLV